MAKFWSRAAGKYDKLVSLVKWQEHQIALADGISGKVLEACCGTGALTRELLSRGIDVTAVDLANGMIQVARSLSNNPERFMVADVTALPFGDKAFDCALCSGALGLFTVEGKKAALRELCRVAREVRLLEPLERHPGFYFGRVLTFFVDGMRPIPRRLFVELGLTLEEHGTVMGGIFTAMTVTDRRDTPATR